MGTAEARQRGLLADLTSRKQKFLTSPHFYEWRSQLTNWGSLQSLQFAGKCKGDWDNQSMLEILGPPAPLNIQEGGHTSGNRTYINTEISDTNGSGILTKIYLKKFWRERLMSAIWQNRGSVPCQSQNNNDLTTTYGPKYLYENFRIKLRSFSNPEKHGSKNNCIEISKFTFTCV